MAAYAALLSLMHIIDTLENHNRPPISLNKNHVHLLIEKITFLQEFLEAYNPNLAYTAEADPLETRIADAAHAAEDVIESHIVDSITSDGEKISSDEVFYEAVEKAIEEMALIVKEAMQIKSQTVSVGLQQHQLHTKSTPPDSSGSSSVAQVQQSRMVGADQLLREMKDKLRSDRLALQVIPITGMGGSGKTTLATNIYQDRLIMEHFHIRAWVTISQEYSNRKILETLLLIGQLIKEDDMKKLSDGELGDMLHKHLYGRRYLIVLDDMWSIRAWEGVRMFLPDNTNGSRIVVTTRLSNLASNLPNPNNSLKMNLLDKNDSWDLLSKTVFGEKDCPLEFEEIGKEIGKRCEGLPLSIVVVGGLLAKSEHTIEVWEYIKENLNSVVNLEDDERYFKILYMSYKQLPVHLKPCFLYMGVFPEDKAIHIAKLIKLWVAEGFLKPVSKKSMEEIGKEYLDELISRNLIFIHKLGRIGNKQYCKIHDLLRDLCLREAEKERFYTVVASPPQGIVKNAAQRRIVVSRGTSQDEVINASLSMPLARSLIWHIRDIQLPPLNLRLLRILETSDPDYRAATTYLESMHQLVNSRYINIMPYGCCESIGRFWNLQTFYSRSWELCTPNFIWYMIHIRHIKSEDFIYLDDNQLQGDNVLGNLQTLEGLSNFKCSKEIVKRIPNIKKLKISYRDGIDDDRYCLNNLVCLDKLESLDFYCYHRGYQGRFNYLHWLIDFPNSLIKLCLQIDEDQYLEDFLDKIGSLPRLQKLKLFGGMFREGQWEATEGRFRSLKFLLLCTGLKLWTTESSHFPCLEHLYLDELVELKEIPLDFAEILTLRVIELDRCSNSAVVSAKRIVEEQVELYGEEEAALQVHVTLSRYVENKAALESLAGPNFHLTSE